MNHAAQWWEELLHSTGGKLELPKCFYYLMAWKFNSEGEASLMTTDETNTTVSLRDSETGSTVHIDQLDCRTAHKTLGAYESPSGEYKDETKRLLTKSREIAQRISCASITQSEARTIYRSMYHPGITYSLPAGTLTRTEAEQVQGAPVKALLCAMGYPNGMPRAVAFGPTESGGIGLRHFFAEQGALK